MRWRRPPSAMDASGLLPCFGNPGSCPAAGGAPEHMGKLAFRERIASLHTEPVRGHRCTIIGLGSENPVAMLPADRGLLPGRMTLRSQALRVRIAVAVAVLPAAGGAG
jgi:phage-related minor tail protein